MGVKKKSNAKKPVLAGFLNLIVPGLGYVYAGKRINFGIALIIFSVFYVGATINQIATFEDYFFGIILSFIFAYDGYRTAKEKN
ncbi:hypothetical protein KAS08_02515 [Candidatus Pacearchaeota archaeon]|nr:hypothetical protein [Candidatus Pacearchaeota archaeon]